MVANTSAIKSQYHKPDSAVVLLSDAALRRSEPKQKVEPEQKVEPKQKVEPEIKISQALLNNVQHEIQKMRNVGLCFSVHEATDRTIVKVIDKETEKLIRQIPPEEFLNLADKMDEMIGILFDKNA